MILRELFVDSPIGRLRLVASDDALVGVHFPELPPAAIDASTARDDGRHPVLSRARDQLAEYFAGERPAFDLPLSPRGTDFQEAVWRALLAIPFGATRSYAAIAAAVGRPSAMRAVGAANGKNPISIIVPCHRVIGADGSLTGYGGGLPRKRWLLRHEGAASIEDRSLDLLAQDGMA
jgi:methylated-DNA-[protein]-cysteine S-methyltransferase